MEFLRARATAAKRPADSGSQHEALTRAHQALRTGVMASFPRPIKALKRRIEELETENLRLFSMAYMDPLTSLWNRNKLNTEFTDALRHAFATDSNVAMVLLDLDRLRDVNNTYGHLAGDAYIASFASLIQRNLRQGDSAYRIGGDEFLILCPGTDQSNAYAIVKRLREQADEAALPFSAGVSDMRNVSEYTANTTDMNRLAEDMSMRADQAGYRHKWIRRLRRRPDGSDRASEGRD